MRVLIASGIYPPDIGGPATYSQLIAREFSKQGVGISLICYSDEPFNKKAKAADEAEPFKIVRIKRGANKLKRYWLYFYNLIKLAKNVDVIYAQGPLAAGLPAMWVSRILRKKFVIKVVGDYAWEQGVNQFGVKDLIEEFNKKTYNKKIEKIRKIQTKVVKSADKIIVPSEFLKKIVKGWGIEENKIEMIYNAFLKPGKINSAGLEGDVIISAGRPEPWKGYSVLKEIMPELEKANSKLRLVVATDFPHDKLLSYFKASEMFVLNTGYEGLSHIILEALACGLPVITTNVCGNPEVIKDGYNGLLVEYNNKKQLKDAILKLWKDKEMQKKFIDNGYKTLEKFKLETMLNKTLRILVSQ